MVLCVGTCNAPQPAADVQAGQAEQRSSCGPCATAFLRGPRALVQEVAQRGSLVPSVRLCGSRQAVMARGCGGLLANVLETGGVTATAKLKVLTRD